MYSPKSVLFEWRVNRSWEGPEILLKDFQGKLQTDGFSAYESLAKERNDLTLVGCWARLSTPWLAVVGGMAPTHLTT